MERMENANGAFQCVRREIVEHSFQQESDDLPAAPEHAVRLARRLMSSGLCPEEYAARNHTRIEVCGIHRYRYPESAMETWVHRLGELLSDPKLLAHYEQQFLTAEELEQAQISQPREEAT
jgi:hypothetical protein